MDDLTPRGTTMTTKIKCKDCVWLDMNKSASIGYLCVCPNIEHKGLGMWLTPSHPACKKGFKEKV